jgi:hypothetical protein
MAGGVEHAHVVIAELDLIPIGHRHVGEGNFSGRMEVDERTGVLG